MPRSRRNRRRIRGGYWGEEYINKINPLGSSSPTDPNGQAQISPPNGESWYSGVTNAFSKLGEYAPSFSKKDEVPVNSTDQYGQPNGQSVQPNGQYGQPNGQSVQPTGGYRRSRRFRGGQVTLPPVGDGIVMYRKSRRRRR